MSFRGDQGLFFNCQIRICRVASKVSTGQIRSLPRPRRSPKLFRRPLEVQLRPLAACVLVFRFLQPSQPIIVIVAFFGTLLVGVIFPFLYLNLYKTDPNQIFIQARMTSGCHSNPDDSHAVFVYKWIPVVAYLYTNARYVEIRVPPYYAVYVVFEPCSGKLLCLFPSGGVVRFFDA